eukprot:6201933-Pleurochrysis_carterae.AAC.1
MARRNMDFAREALPTERRKSKEAHPQQRVGLFNSLSLEMREAVVTMAARDFDDELMADRNDLSAHREARRRKEELAREHGMQKLTESYIDA